MGSHVIHLKKDGDNFSMIQPVFAFHMNTSLKINRNSNFLINAEIKHCCTAKKLLICKNRNSTSAFTRDK